MSGNMRDDQVRLVSILDPGSGDVPIHVSRQHFYTLRAETDQTGTPSYIAISYTWGEDRDHITCDDRDLEVSSNLVPALRLLQRHYPDRLFWTDSISIDQQDVGEKAHQVSMMGQIFAAADTVAVWFGEDSEDIYQRLHDSKMDARDDGTASKARVELMRRLSEIPWFYRAWTFQEIRLARDAVVMLGSRLMPWKDFIDRVQVLRSFEPQLSTVEIRSQPRSYSRFTYKPKDQFFGILDELNSGVSTDLAGLLFVTWYRAASVKHDKIYALLSSALLNDQRHGINIDYSVTFSSLCIRAARACINTASNLKILKIAGMKLRWKSGVTNKWDPNELNHLLGHPSWAPNWWEPPQQTRTSASLIYDERGCFSELAFCCPETPPPQSTDDISPFLVLKGVVLGIFNIGDPPSFPGGPTFVHAPPFCANAHLREWLNRPDTPNRQVPALQGASKVYMPEFVEGVQRHLQSRCSCVPYHERSGNHFGPLQPWTAPVSPGNINLMFNNTYFSVNHGRAAPSVVGKGVPKDESSFPAEVLATSVESGDWLVLLQGGGMPFVLRPVMDRMGNAQKPEAIMTPEERKKINLPGGAGCFVLVGEASMYWDQLWPRMWDMYCRAGDFVIM